MVATDRVAPENNTAGRRYVVDDNVGGPALAAGHIRQGDEPIEAVLERRRPGPNRAVYGIELLIGGRRVRLDGDRKIRVVPPIAGVIVAQNDEGLCVGVRQAASGTPPPPALANAVAGISNIQQTNSATTTFFRALMGSA